MSDQPVTPDREALIEVLMRTPFIRSGRGWDDPTRDECRGVVDALLPLLTEALDRARQQGRDEGREEAAQVIEAHRDRPLDGWAEKAYAFLSFPGGGRNEVQDALTVAARLARGPNRKDEE